MLASKNIRKLFFWAIFIVAVFGQCLSPIESLGKCSACSADRVLISGQCFMRMVGCVNQLSVNQCQECIDKFTLVNQVCMSNAALAANSSSNSSNSTPKYWFDSPYSYLQIYATASPDFNYDLINNYFRLKYSSALSTRISNLSKLVSLKTTYGQIFAITYCDPRSPNPETNQYIAQGAVDYNNTIIEYMFGLKQPGTKTDDKSTLWMIERRIFFRNLGTLDNALLNKIQQLDNNTYRYFYINFSGGIFVQDIQLIPNPSANTTFPNLTSLFYEINENTVLNYVFSQYPTLQIETNYTVNYYVTYSSNGTELDYYKFVFDNEIIVTVQINGLQIILAGYEEPDNLIFLLGNPNATTPKSNNSAAVTALGGYRPFLDQTDKNYQNALKFLISQYTIVKTKTVSSVRYQLVAGTNFMITFTSLPFSEDEYVAIVYQPLKGIMQIKNLTLNGIDIMNNKISNPLMDPSNYNYEADPTFYQLYTFFRAQIRISSLLPIQKVKKIINDDKTIDYLITYSSDQYSVAKYNPDPSAQPYSILSFVADGTELYSLAQSLGAQPTLRTRETIYSFLLTQKPYLFGSSVIIKYSSGNDMYMLDLLTPYGTYFAKVIDRGVMYLSVVTQTSEDLCSDLDSSQFTQNSAVANMNSFIRTSYASNVTSSYQLSLVQASIDQLSNNSTYRLLYSNADNRMDVSIGSALGKYFVKQITGYSGTACKNSEVLIGGNCVKNYPNFL